MATGAEPGCQTNATAMQMATGICGDGRAVAGASYSGARLPLGVYSEGLTAESFLHGPQPGRLSHREIVDEICTPFPECIPDTGAGYCGAARRGLCDFEARGLLATAKAA